MTEEKILEDDFMTFYLKQSNESIDSGSTPQVFLIASLIYL